MTPKNNQTPIIKEKEIKKVLKITQLLNDDNCMTRSNYTFSASQVQSEEETHSEPLGQAPKSNRGRNKTPIAKDQIEQLISYIVNNKMTVAAASREVNMNRTTAWRYYNMYKENPEQRIPAPGKRTRFHIKYYTQDQVKKLIGYIVDNKLSIQAASAKVNITASSARTYYVQYLNDPNHKIPVPRKNVVGPDRLCTQDKIKELIGYIANEKMSIEAASLKAKVPRSIGKKYYMKYINDPNHTKPIPRKYNLRAPTDNQIKELINLIVNEDSSVHAASKRVKMHYSTAYNYYRRYMENPKRKIPLAQPSKKRYTDEQIKELINYINNDKLTIRVAAQKVNMSYPTAYRYNKKHNEEFVRHISESNSQ